MAGMISGPAPKPEDAGPAAAAKPAKAAPAAQGGFKRPDLTDKIPPEQQDAVARIVAAGQRVMYAPQTRQTIMQVVQGKDPVQKKLAEAVVGLLLVLDQKAKGQGGLPIEALPWAGMELLGEAADILSAAKQPVSQEDYQAAATMVGWHIARKIPGATDEQIVAGLQQGGKPAAGQQKPAAPAQGAM